MPKYLTTRAAGAVPILPLAADELKPWLKSQPSTQRPSVAAWVDSLRFTAKAGTHCLLPGADGALARVLVGVDPVALTFQSNTVFVHRQPSREGLQLGIQGSAIWKCAVNVRIHGCHDGCMRRQ